MRREIEFRLPGGSAVVVNALGQGMERFESETGIAIAVEVSSDEPANVALVASELENAAAALRATQGGAPNRPKGW